MTLKTPYEAYLSPIPIIIWEWTNGQKAKSNLKSILDSGIRIVGLDMLICIGITSKNETKTPTATTCHVMSKLGSQTKH